MRTEQEIKKKLDELEKRPSSSSANMNYERGGAEEALQWVLEVKDCLVVGYRP